MIYSVVPYELIFADFGGAESRPPQAILSTNPRDFLTSSEIRIRP
jgi:hypothetical protein